MLKVSIFSGQSYSRPYINVIPVMMKKVFWRLQLGTHSKYTFSHTKNVWINDERTVMNKCVKAVRAAELLTLYTANQLDW